MRMNRSPFAQHTRQPRARDNELFIYDEIGFFGVQAEEFTRSMRTLDADEIHIRLNSPGGSVFEGTAIAHAIERQDRKTVIHVDGLAASIASLIAIAADDVRIAEGAFFMIHDPWSIVLGSADDLRKEAEVLDLIADTLAKQIARRTNMDLAEVTALMRAETWFNADDAVDAGLADAIDEGKAAVENKFDLSVFGNVPEGLRKKTPAVRDIEHALRDAGYSKNEARAFVSAGKQAVDRCDAGETQRWDAVNDTLKQLLKSIQKS